MFLVVLAVLIGGVVFVAGLLTRKRRIILAGTPAALLLVIWFFLANSRPNPQKEFGRLFGADGRSVATGIRTFKPTLMDGYFMSFRMHPADFETRIRPKFSEVPLTSPTQFLLRQELPAEWPASIQTAESALRCEVDHSDMYLLYFANEETAYVSVQYEQW